MSCTNALHLGNSQKEWLRKLDFYFTEIEFLEGRLSEMKKRKGMSREVAAFHYEFSLLRTNIDQLKHQIRSLAHMVADGAQQHDGKIEGALLEDQDKIEGDMFGLEMNMKEIHRDFNKYLAN